MLYSCHRLRLILSYIIVLICPTLVSGDITFTVVTPVVRAIPGVTARLVWNYTVDDRTNEFQAQSPIWHKIYSNGTKSKLMFDNLLLNWNFTIPNECPDAYKTRIGREGVATMFIKDVNKGDTGNYSCVLMYPGGATSGDKTIELIVSDPTPAPTPTSSVTPTSTINSGGSTPTNATINPPPPTEDHTGAIVGGVIGGLAVVVLAGLGIWWCCYKKKEGRAVEQPEENDQPLKEKPVQA